MPKTQRRGGRNPIFFAFGDRHEFLDNDAARAATPEMRIRSIWPFLVRRVKDFQRSLKPRERANFGPEDTLSELFVVLLERDGQWDPERGKYITFAGSIIDHELCAIRDRSRTVHSPRNSACRMKEYDQLEAAGELSERRRRTAEKVRRVSGGVRPIAAADPAAGRTPDPIDLAEARDRGATSARMLKLAVRKRLTPYESVVVAMTAGLDGGPVRSIAQVARATDTDPAEVRRARAGAYRKIRDFVSAHAPTIAEA